LCFSDQLSWLLEPEVNG